MLKAENDPRRSQHPTGSPEREKATYHHCSGSRSAHIQICPDPDPSGSKSVRIQIRPDPNPSGSRSVWIQIRLDPDPPGSVINWSQRSGSENENFGSGSSPFHPKLRNVFSSVKKVSKSSLLHTQYLDNLKKISDPKQDPDKNS